MKKLTILAMLLLFVVCLTALVSCGGGNKASATTADTEATIAPSTTAIVGTTAVTTEKPAVQTSAVTTKPVETTTPVTEEARVKPEEIILNKIRVQLLSDTLVRLEVAMTGGKFQDQASYSVINREDWYKVDYTVETDGDNTIIKTKIIFYFIMTL